jgi:hypothetical protein
MAMLIHHGDRSSVANKEFLAIFNFKREPPVRAVSGEAAVYGERGGALPPQRLPGRAAMGLGPQLQDP